MKQFTFIVLLSIVYSISIAQVLPEGISLILGNEFKTSGNEEIQRIVTESNGNIIAYTRNLSQFEFLLFDENLNLTKSSKAVLKSGDRTLHYNSVVETAQGLYVFSTYTDDKLYREVLYFQELDRSNLTLSSAKILHTKAYNAQGGEIQFMIKASPNGEMIMVDVSSKISNYSIDYGKESFDIVVFNSDFDRLWRDDEIALYENDERGFRNERKVTNSGQVIMMLLQWTGDLDEIEDVDEVMNMFSYFVVVLSKNEEYTLFELKLDAGYFADLKYEIDPEENINLIALSYDKNEDSRSWYYAIIDPVSGAFLVENKSTFKNVSGIIMDVDDPDENTVKLIRNSSFVGESDLLSPTLLITQIYPDKEGTTVVFESGANSTNSYSKVKTTVGIGIVRFDASGEQLWRKGIKKIQYSEAKNEKFTSYAEIGFEGQISFVFNFIPEKEISESIGNYGWDSKNTSDLYLATIDKTGDLNTSVILKGTKSPFWIPIMNYQVNPSELVLLGSSGKKSKMVKLSINN